MESFLTLSKILNYRKTAEALFISEPSLSTQIRQLEGEYNCELIDRSKRQIKLTAAGEQLALSATRLFEEVQRTNTLMYRFNQANHHFFKIAASGVHLVFPLAKQLESTYPATHFSFAEMSNQEIIHGVVDSTITVGFSFLDTVPNSLMTTGIFTDTLIAVARVDDSSFDSVGQINAIDLLDHRLAVLQNGFYIRRAVSEFFRLSGIAPNYTYTLESYHACIDQVKKQMSVTIVPLSFFQSLEDPMLKGIRLIGDQSPLSMGLIYRQEQSTNPVIRSIKELARLRYVVGKQ